MSTSPPGDPLSRQAWHSTLSLFLALVLASAVLSGCSDDPPPPTSQAPADPGDPSATYVGVATPSEPTTSTAVAHVIGRLPSARRKAVRKQVSAVVDRWWERAYLDVDQSRVKTAKAFPGFTAGAASRARADRSLMTNGHLRGAPVTPLMRKVRLDLLAVNGRARTVTARFDLRVRTSGPRKGRLRVHGRLFLVRKPAGWRVFGYDVSKGWL